MLNANAKAFVPAGVPAAPVEYPEHSWYRYRLNTTSLKKTNTSTDARRLNNVSSLLAAKDLFAMRDGLDEETLQLFINEALLSASNTSQQDVQPPFSGFLLSRSILALHADANAVNAANDAMGYLLHVNVPRECGGAVTMPLAEAWAKLFPLVKEDRKVSCVGYCSSFVGQGNDPCSGTYRHYFFVALATGSDVNPKDFARIKQVTRVSRVHSVVPFACSLRIPLSLIITVGEKAKKALGDEPTADHTFTIAFSPNDANATIRRIAEFTEKMAAVLSGDSRWERTEIAHVHIDVSGHENMGSLTIWDVLLSIGSFCEDINSCIAGVSVSNETTLFGRDTTAPHTVNPPFFVNASLQDMLAHDTALDTENGVLGMLPGLLQRQITVGAWESGKRAVELQRNMSALLKEVLLNRATFAEAAGHFANFSFLVRRNADGVSVLVGVSGSGETFAVDLRSQRIFVLPPNSFANTSSFPPDCLFQGTLVPTFRGSAEYKIVLHDVLVFRGNNVRNLPFQDRWAYMGNLAIGDEESWPHATSTHLVILKAIYTAKENCNDLLASTSALDFPTRGLAFVPMESSDKEKAPSYLWIPPGTATATFSAFSVEKTASEDNLIVNRVRLAVRDNKEPKKMIPYENEYADFQAEAYPDLHVGAAVQCLLRRADDGAHWWDVIRDFYDGTEEIANFETVDSLVHCPNITKEEMLWLLSSSSYRCGRCHKVDDDGQKNSRHGTYWCKNCWRETGHGDCVYCLRSFVLGMLDAPTQLFYCENCWNNFSSRNEKAEVGYHVPPPPTADYAQQVSTRCVSLLIDQVNGKGPTNDILDLCCGGSVVRKWMRNKTASYLGVDIKTSVVDTTLNTISTCANELPANARYNCICADAFSEDFWTESITHIHPRQFHLIACFSGMHHAFANEERARHFLGSVANALVPGGMFIGTFVDGSTAFAKGRKYANGVFRTEWDANAVPRISNTFRMSTGNGTMREINVVPIDFLLAVSSEYGLNVLSEMCLTFRECIEKDPNWTKVPNTEEKEYLCLVRTFAFKKQAVEQAPQTPFKA